MTHDISDKFAKRVSEQELARILELIAQQANRRDRAIPGDVEGQFDYWFDGGACRVQTGSVEFEFLDGTAARLGVPVPSLSLSVRFPDGGRTIAFRARCATDR